MRIAISGIQIESSTFTLHVAGLDDFIIRRGDEILAAHPLAEWAPGVEFIGTLNAFAGAGGPVSPDVYDALESEMLERLRAAGPVDGVWLDMHGAMNVLGRTRAEERWVRAVRGVVGPDVILSGSFDPHGNLSRELVELIDLAAFHRHAPHIDNVQTRERAVKNLISVLQHGGRPYKAWVPLPLLLPGEFSATIAEPGAAVFGSQVPVIEKYGLIDAAMCVGFFWADEDRNCAAVLSTSWDEDGALAASRDLAETFWGSHADFGMVTERYGPWGKALQYALGRPGGPLYISDSGDNVTAGGTGDVTYALQQTLANSEALDSGLRFLFAGIWDPEAVDAAAAAGEDATIAIEVGARIDARYAAAVKGPWQVLKTIADSSGRPQEAQLRGRGVDVTVRKTRTPFVQPDDPALPVSFAGTAPFDTRDYDVVVVKNGYLFPSQAAAAASDFMAITPGGTDLDYERLGFHRVNRPIYPLDDDFPVVLRPEIVPSVDGGGQ